MFSIALLLSFIFVRKNILTSFLLLGFISLFPLEGKSIERVLNLQPPHVKNGRFLSYVTASHIQSDQNYGAQKNKISIVGQDFQTTQVYAGALWDFSQVAAFELAGVMARSHAKINAFQHEHTYFKGALVGFQYKKHKVAADLNLAFDFKYFQSLQSSNYSKKKTALGDNLSWGLVGMWLGTRSFEYGSFWLYGGVRQPVEFSESSHFLYQLRLNLGLPVLGGGFLIEGQEVLKKADVSGSEVARLLYVDQYQAGSFEYSGINSSYLEWGAWVGVEVYPSIYLQFGLRRLLSGAAVASGTRYMLSLNVEFSFGRLGYGFPYRRHKKEEFGADKVKTSKLKDYKKK